MNKPLLVIDIAPIMPCRGAGAIVGFAIFLLEFYESEQPRAVLVGWDTLDEALPIGALTF